MASKAAQEIATEQFNNEILPLLGGNGPNFEKRDTAIKARLAAMIDNGVRPVIKAGKDVDRRKDDDIIPRMTIKALSTALEPWKETKCKQKE